MILKTPHFNFSFVPHWTLCGTTLSGPILVHHIKDISFNIFLNSWRLREYGRHLVAKKASAGKFGNLPLVFSSTYVQKIFTWWRATWQIASHSSSLTSALFCINVKPKWSRVCLNYFVAINATFTAKRYKYQNRMVAEHKRQKVWLAVRKMTGEDRSARIMWNGASARGRSM